MSININPMGWSQDKATLDYNKRHVPKPYHLIVENGNMLPFQLHYNDDSSVIFPIIFQILDLNGTQVVQKLLTGVSDNTYTDTINGVVYIRQNGPIGDYDLEDGCYTAIVSTSSGNQRWYSEVFRIHNDVSKFVQIQYSSKDNLILDDGIIYFANSFKFKFYLDTTILRPTYEYEEEAEEKNGNKFVSLQVAKKIFRMSAPVPEYLADAMSIIRLCNFVRVIAHDRVYNCVEFIFSPEWPEYGDLANGDIEFITSSTFKKVNAFYNIDNLGEYSDVQYNDDYKNNNG